MLKSVSFPLFAKNPNYSQNKDGMYTAHSLNSHPALVITEYKMINLCTPETNTVNQLYFN